MVADEGFDGRVIEIATRGATLLDEPDGCAGAMVEVAAGESWSDFVAHASGRGWVGVETLIGIPGSVGATPIQNVGAYGQQVSDTIARVRAWDRSDDRVRTFAAADCGFGYRTSRFKQEPGRFVVLSVTFQLELGHLSAALAYAELAQRLDVGLGERAPLGDVNEAVLALRAGKGMVLDARDHDTWSAGSFFTNPIVGADRVPEGAPSWPTDTDQVKTSAAWLIDHAGFGKGYPHRDDAPASLSTKHTLALTNRGNASTADVLALANEIRVGVLETFGIPLEPEPNLVGCALD